MSLVSDERVEELLAKEVALEVENAKLRMALNELVEACEYVKPFAGAVAVKASVKDIRQAGRFVKAVEHARDVAAHRGE